MNNFCPFSLFKKQLKNNNICIKTYNPNNGFIKHYWTYDECQHILNHLNGRSCNTHDTIFPYKGQLIQVNYNGKDSELLYDTESKLNTIEWLPSLLDLISL